MINLSEVGIISIMIISGIMIGYFTFGIMRTFGNMHKR